MPGLFGMLNLGTRALQTQQEGVQIAGQNLANVNNPAYARQRVVIQTTDPLATSLGPEGTGVAATAIQQVRSTMLDQQIQGENSITAYLQTQQSALQDAEAGLGEQLQTSSSTATTGTVTASGGLADGLTSLFNAFQTLSTTPASLTDRQQVVSQARQLAARFNQVDRGLDDLKGQLNQSVTADVASANQLLSDVAGLNHQIKLSEAGSGATANDLRDLRQQKLEDLAKLVNFQSGTASDGTVSVTIGGQLLVDGAQQPDRLQAYDAGGGQWLVGTAGAATRLTLSGGSIQGTIDARDTTLATLQTGLDQIAGQLITQVNDIYRSGYDLNGNTGADFFTGTGAADIGVNAGLVSDASQFQAAGVSDATGNNQVVVALAKLGSAKQAALGNQTFSANYHAKVAALGTSISEVTTQLSDQQVVQNMLTSQRSSVSGVSLDEEMTSLMQFQHAFQASAHLISTIDDLLTDVVNLKAN